MSILQKLIALEHKACAFGFEWPDINMILDQIVSECDEIKEAVKFEQGQKRLQEEAGDLLHAAISLCVFKGWDVEQTLTQITEKFEARLNALIELTKQNGHTSLKGQSFDFMLEMWHEAKQLTQISPPALQPLIRTLGVEDIPSVVNECAACKWPKSASIFEAYLQEQLREERLIWGAFLEEKFAGYITLKWQSSYEFFRENNIPEIKDLNVLPPYRGKGVGSLLLDTVEDVARQRGSCVGIGVGLDKGYGNAQRLYVSRNYIPDGLGITYKGRPVEPRSMVCLDDDLILWLTKDLGGK